MLTERRPLRIVVFRSDFGYTVAVATLLGFADEHWTPRLISFSGLASAQDTALADFVHKGGQKVWIPFGVRHARLCLPKLRASMEMSVVQTLKLL